MSKVTLQSSQHLSVLDGRKDALEKGNIVVSEVFELFIAYILRSQTFGKNVFENGNLVLTNQE